VQGHLRALLISAIKIDTTQFIETWVKQISSDGVAALQREIQSVERVLANFGKEVHRDAPGEAHTMAYLVALKSERSKLVANPFYPSRHS
jgi:hypothetical protein